MSANYQPASYLLIAWVKTTYLSREIVQTETTSQSHRKKKMQKLCTCTRSRIFTSVHMDFEIEIELKIALVLAPGRNSLPAISIGFLEIFLSIMMHLPKKDYLPLRLRL